MKIEKLLWSKTKTDILKYLIFKQEGISLRALENVLKRSFPAIKKQVDILEESWIVYIDKISSGWEVYIKEDLKPFIRKIFLYSLYEDILDLINENDNLIKEYFLGKLFWYELPDNIDLVFIYDSQYSALLDKFKFQLDKLLESYFLDKIIITFLDIKQFYKRYTTWDKFAITLKGKWWKKCI